MIRNMHERFLAAEPAAVGAFLDTLGSDQDTVWLGDDWWPMVLDRPLEVGASSGHADTRYTVDLHEPGRRVVFRFDPACGLSGSHAFEAEPCQGGVVLRHDLTARPLGRNRLLYPLVIRPIHDAMVEDAFDRIHERVVPGRTQTPWSPYVRLLRRLVGLAPRSRRVPGAVRPVAAPRDGLLSGPCSHYADAYAIDLPPDASTDPDVWRRRVFGSPPVTLSRLTRLRDFVVRPLGLRDAADLDPRREGFPVLARSADEVLMGADDRHLDFRVSVRVVTTADAPSALVLRTTVRFHGALGRLYFIPVRPFHRRIVPVLLRRAVAMARRG